MGKQKNNYVFWLLNNCSKKYTFWDHTVNNRPLRGPHEHSLLIAYFLLNRSASKKQKKQKTMKYSISIDGI